MSNVYDTARDKYGVADPKALLGRFQSTVDKWEGLFSGVDRSDSSAIAAIIKSELFDKIDVASYGK